MRSTKTVIILTFTFLVSLLVAAEIVNNTKKLPAIGTKEIVGNIDGVDIEILVQSPAAQETPLQIICAFEYTEGDIFNSPPALPRDLNGMLHVDEAFKGMITKLRKSGKFKGQTLETLLIIPAHNTIPARKLLMIGLGNRDDFTPETMRMIGLTGMREALRLGVSSYSHASDLKDAGVDSPTVDVASSVIQGAIEAYRTQMFLKQQNVSETPTVNKVTLLCGPAYFEDSKLGAKRTIEKEDWRQKTEDRRKIN